MALYLVNLQCIPRANLNFYWTFTSDILKTNKMKKLVIISTVAIALLSSCVTQKMGTYTYNDDVYANPKEDRILEARIAAEKKQAKEAADKRYNDSLATLQRIQKEKDDANPYYKDREFKYDDYYDYEYATRVRRFNNGITGLSYYDNYYTNSYWYNNNPYNYGISVYNGYSWWGSNYNNYSYNPSVNFYNSWGWGFGNQFNGFNGYNPYMAGYMQGYNNGFNNGMWGNYYGFGNPYGNGFGFGNHHGFGYGAPFGYGFGNPYGFGGFGNPYGFGGMGYNNGWGYFNAFDNNSSYSYGPRSSHGGGNSRRVSNPGLAEQYKKEISDKQTTAVKFSEVKTPRNNSLSPVRGDNNGAVGNTPNPVRTNPITTIDEPVRNNPPRTQPIRGNDPIKANEPIKGNDPIKVKDPIRSNPIRNTEPVKQPIESTPKIEPPRQNNATPSSPFNNGNSNPGNNGGGNAPRNNGGGGHRPR